MVSEFLVSRINIAHDLINQTAYPDAVKLLKQLKTRIHKKEALELAKKFEEDHDKTLEERLKNIYTMNIEATEQKTYEDQQWLPYAEAYLKFYDELIIDYDI